MRAFRALATRRTGDPLIARIEDHIDYLMVRIDPDKMAPLKSEAQSQEYLSKPASRGD